MGGFGCWGSATATRTSLRWADEVGRPRPVHLLIASGPAQRDALLMFAFIFMFVSMLVGEMVDKGFPDGAGDLEER